VENRLALTIFPINMLARITGLAGVSRINFADSAWGLVFQALGK
jgi:hypothetical protein